MFVPGSCGSAVRRSRFCGPLATTQRIPAAGSDCCLCGPYCFFSLSRHAQSNGRTRSSRTPGASLKNWLNRVAPNDQVWVNHDAVAAFEFYLQKKDPRFIYGKFHADANEYIPELIGSIDPHTDRLWLVFSHLEQASDRGEEQLIVSSLRADWDVHSVIAPTNAELYRRTSKDISIEQDGGSRTMSSRRVIACMLSE